MKTNFLRDTENELQGINYELFEKYFKFSVPTVFTKALTKTVTNHRFKKLYTWLITGLMKDLAGLLNLLSLNTLIFQPLSGSSYMDLTIKLRSPRKGSTNIKKKKR